MSDSSKRDLRKVKSACLLALLLLPGIMIALPAVSVFHVSASTGSTPATVTGAAATIDAPILAGIGAGTPDTRTITINNPQGNPGITQLTISVPTTASTAAPSGTIPSWGGVPACSGTCTITASGNGPWALIYQHSGTDVILPGGASISVTITVTPETSTVAGTHVADTPSLGVAATDTTGANTVLNSIQLYYTTSTTAAVGTPSSTSVTAGSTFTFTATTATTVQSGLPLYVSVTTGTAKTTSISPTTFTSGSSSQTVTVNDTTSDASLILMVGGAKPNTNVVTPGGVLTNASITTVAVNAGTASKLAITVNGATSKQILNVTSAIWAGGSAIPGTSISISATDKFGNVATVTGVSLNVAVNTLSGQTAGFSSTTSSYSGSYPYTPTGGVAASLATFVMGSSTINLGANNYFYGVDYGSASQITVAASGASLASTTSALIKTYTLSSTLTSISSSSYTPAAGGTFTLTATGGSPAQAGVPVWFLNATDYSTLTSTATKAVTSVSSGTETATWTVAVPTKTGTSTTFTAEEVLFNNNVGSFTGTGNPLTNSSATSATSSIVTQPGAVSKLVVSAYLSNPASSPITYPFSKTSYPVSTVVVPKGTMYIDAVTTDAFGNSVPVAGVTQIALSTSAGSLSVTTVLTIPNGGIDLAASAGSGQGSQTTVAFTPPTTVGSTATIIASGTGLTSGTVTITVVTATPNLVVQTSPTTITAGVPSTFSGIVNATKGIQGDQIASISYSVNGGAASTVTIGAANAAWTFSVLLTASANSITITATDSQGTPNTNTLVLSVPAIPAALTFTNSTALKQVNFVGGPAAVNATFTNNAASTLTVIIVANVLNAQGAVILESTATVTAASGATVSGYPVIQGIPHGTYTVSVTVYSTAYVTLSPTKTLTVTV